MTDETPAPPGRKRRLYGLVAEAVPYFDVADENVAGFLRPKKRAMVDIFVSKESLPRALDTASAVFRALRERGYVVGLGRLDARYARPEVYPRGHDNFSFPTWSRWFPDRPTMTTIDDVPLGFSFFETTTLVDVEPHGFDAKKLVRASKGFRAQPHRPTRKADMPSDTLVLRAYAATEESKWQKEWAEERRGSIKKSATQIVDELVAAVPGIKQEIEARRAQATANAAKWAEERKRREERAEIERRAKAAADSAQELRAIIAAWQTAQGVVAFFADVERTAQSLSDEAREPLLRRLERARTMIVGDDAATRLLAWRTPDER